MTPPPVDLDVFAVWDKTERLGEVAAATDAEAFSLACAVYGARPWLVVVNDEEGGESGAGARPCNVQWIRDLAQQCEDAGVRVGVKQLGANAVDTSKRSRATRRIAFDDAKGGAAAEWPADIRRYAITDAGAFWGMR